MGSFFLNSYVPLAASKAGREASLRFDIEPFVDGSIRREPDLEHEYPAITCLCRADKFAPRLAKGDIVAYMLRKGRYGLDHPQRRLTAVLRVVEIFPTHSAGAAWYGERNLALPNNCWVRGNSAKPFDQSHRLYKTSNAIGPEQTFHEWDLSYRARALKFGSFVVSERLFWNLSWNAPEITEAVLGAVFGTIPGTRNPGRWTIRHATQLLERLSLNVSLFDP